MGLGKTPVTYRIFIISVVIILIASAIMTSCAAKGRIIVTEGVDYYISNEGNDDNNGRSPGSPWKTLVKVNNYDFSPGDKVRFKCGDAWRGQLMPKSGSEAGKVWYTSYGFGDKPVIMGSVNKSSVTGWVCEGESIWVSKPEIEWMSDIELLTSHNPVNGVAGWSLYNNAASGACSVLSESAGRYEGGICTKIEVTVSGAKESDIQLSMGYIAIEAGKTYKLSFAARSSEDATVSSVKLMKGTAPFGRSSDTVVSMRLTKEWTGYEYFFNCRTTEPGAKICFYLGNMPGNGTELFIDGISFKECTVSGLIDTDAGNFILDGENGLSEKVWNEEDLDDQNKFWYDRYKQSVKIYSAVNPALIYKDIECALTRYIIDETNCCYVGYDGLCLKFGAGDAISNTTGHIHHITIRNCDICHIGGGFTSGVYENGLPARYGNGIQIWGSANDIVIEHCKIWEIYDAAISPQCTVTNRTYNIYIRNNKLSGFEYGLELWNRPEDSVLNDVYFEHNELEGAGMCWAHNQRPNPRAAFFELHYTNSSAYNIFIRHNTCRESVQYFINVLNGASFSGIGDMVINNNVYYIGNDGGEGWIFAIWTGGKKYAADAGGVGEYIAATGKDADSRFIFN